jgi:uncharacterized membrane protein SpoIIM required for sporulation
MAQLMAQQPSAAVTLRSFEFRREREATWVELEQLLALIEQKGLRRLAADQMIRLPLLYRATLSSLSVARSISLDRNLLDYLESLAARAYFAVYGTRRHLREAVADFLAWRFPAAVRRFRWHLALAAAFLLLGALAGFFITAENPDRFYTFVDAELAGGRGPSASTAELRGVLYDEGSVADALAGFASFLFTHNARIGMFAFALGFLAGLPVFLLVFTNGLMLGAFGALYASRGLSLDFWGWVLPHGITELGAVVLCGGAGLVLAQALVFPGRSTRLRNLAAGGRRAAVVVIGAVVLFFIAGLIEGIFRQTVHSVPVRYGVAAFTAVWWIFYFGWVGRRRERLEAARPSLGGDE